MSRKASVAVNTLASFHRGRTGAKVLENHGFPALVDYPIALEYDSVFVLPSRISFRKFGPFLDSNAEQSPEMNLALFQSGLGCDIRPFSYDRVIPNSAFPESSPFRFTSTFGLLGGLELFLPDWTCNTRWYPEVLRNLGSMRRHLTIRWHSRYVRERFTRG